MEDYNDILSKTTDQQVFTTRIIDYPVKEVYDAWSVPEKLAAWWGPNGFTNTFHLFNQTPGGQWRYTMHGPNGVGNYLNKAYFLVVVPQKRLVWNRTSQPFFYTFVEFEAMGSQTRINWIMAFEDERIYRSMVNFVPEKNEENLNRLEAFLAGNPLP